MALKATTVIAAHFQTHPDKEFRLFGWTWLSAHCAYSTQTCYWKCNTMATMRFDDCIPCLHFLRLVRMAPRELCTSYSRYGCDRLCSCASVRVVLHKLDSINCATKHSLSRWKLHCACPVCVKRMLGCKIAINPSYIHKSSDKWPELTG